MAPCFFIRSLTLFLLGSATVLADLTCKAYRPRGTTSNRGKIHFTGIYDVSQVPEVNATVGNPVVLDVNRPDGTLFHFQTCNSISLGYKAYSYYGDCEEPNVCYTIYTDYVRIINPVSGHCLTSRPLPNSNFAEIFLKTCNGNPTDGSQLFLTQQFVEHSNGTNPQTYYMQSFVYHKEAVGHDPNRAYATWRLAADNKTILYDTTRDPISAQTNVLAPIEM